MLFSGKFLKPNPTKNSVEDKKIYFDNLAAGKLPVGVGRQLLEPPRFTHLKESLSEPCGNNVPLDDEADEWSASDLR